MTTPREKASAVRLAAIVGFMLLLLAAFLWASGRLGGRGLTTQKLIDRMQGEKVFAGFRRAHAKGVCLTGSFQSSGALAPYSRSPLFARGSTPLLGRFSLGGGNPTAPDLKAPVRSLAFVLSQPDGQQWRSAMNTPPVLAVGTPQAFFDQIGAMKPDPATGKPDPARIAAFFAAHPESAPFRAWQAAYKPSSSWATERYNSINAFYLVAPDGSRRAVRWQAVPKAAAIPMQESDDPLALQKELAARLARGPVEFDLMFTFAGAGDDPADATKPWPAGRQQLSAGVLSITAMRPQAGGACNGLTFDPLVLPDGIAASDDPILRARSSAYAESYRRRARETALGEAR
ncbi:catalase family peroxidase [Rhizorhabdus phycosphaerae]|uniref:catalase family peroxidase n=1 Tax=Rhizorhabdus phycosphaerae TaxID=2711156 RepID=UPI0013EB3B96|nr:catalase family peroxidase [Rhizorhabdus phycosphaerae]